MPRARQALFASSRWFVRLGAVAALSSCGELSGGESTNSAASILDDLALQPGEAAIALRYRDSPRDEAIEIVLKTTDAQILYGRAQVCPPGWSMRVQVQHPQIPQQLVSLFVGFKDTSADSPQMRPGEGAVTVVSVDLPYIEHGGRVSEPKGPPVVVTSSNGTQTSGHYENEVTIETRLYGREDVRGPELTLRGITFADIRTENVVAPGACRPATPPPNNDCVATYQGRCFPSVEAACQAACGRKDCNVEDSLPAHVGCD